MKSINALLDETNISGIESTILFLPSVAVSSFPLQKKGAYDIINLNEIHIEHILYNRWITLIHSQDSGILKEEIDSTDQNPKYEYKLECFVPKYYNFRPFQFQELSQIQHLVICKDQNENLRLLGVSEPGRYCRGCNMTWKYSTGKTAKDRNGYLITFTFDSSKPAPAVKGLLGIPIETATYPI